MVESIDIIAKEQAKIASQIYYCLVKSVDKSLNICTIVLENKEYTVPFYGGVPKENKTYAIFLPQNNINQAFVIGEAVIGEVASQDIVPITMGGTNASTRHDACANLQAFFLGSPQVAIPANSNLNDYKTAGSDYYVLNSSIASTIINTPTASSGYKLIILYGSGSTNVRQIVITNGSNTTYSRHYTNSSDTWTAWGRLLDTGDLPLSVVNGGTGAATATNARTNLGLDDVYLQGILPLGDVGSTAKTITLDSTAWQPCLIVTNGISTARQGMYIVGLRRTSSSIVTSVVAASAITITAATGTVTISGSLTNTFGYFIPLNSEVKNNITIT